MKYNQLIVDKNKSSKRVGRGISAGQGKTAGRGTKGQKARAGSGKKEGFEGGQTPIMKRTPKVRGFRSIHAKKEVVYTSDLNSLKGTVDNASLASAGLVSSEYAEVKILAKGELTAKLAVHTQGASSTAKEGIQKAGGTFTKVARPSRPAKAKSE